MIARARCNAECERAVISGIRALMRIFMNASGWWLAGFLGTLAVSGALYWGWDWIRDWWDR